MKTNLGLRPHFDFWKTSRYELSLREPLVMGIVNVTPDSFSSDVNNINSKNALEEAEKMLKSGADILDVGGESTRPGALPLTAEQEWSRIQPVLHEMLTWDVPISIDTYHAQTMHRALDMGVDIINDVWALRQGDALSVVAKYRCGICLMHMHGEPVSMQLTPMTGDAVHQVCDFFVHQLQRTDDAGIDRQRIVIDPGIGFGKTVEQNFQLLRDQAVFKNLNLPMLIGWSRKSSLGAVTGLSVDQRMVPSVAAALIAIDRGANIVRVHDVEATLAALAVWKAASQH